MSIERRASYPMLPLHFFRNRDFTGSVLVIGIMFFGGPATFFFPTQFFQLVQGKDPFEAGLLILPNAAAIVAASALAPPLSGASRPPSHRHHCRVDHGGCRGTVHADQPRLVGATEIAVVMLFGFGFGLGMPALTDAIMASVPVQDGGVGSAVNDVSRELGSALGVAAIGSFISSIYRGNVEERLDGVVDGSVVEAAKEGLGVLGGQAEALPADVALTAIGESSGAFVDAMNSGFWLSAAVLVAGAVLAYTLLPAVSRVEQVERGDEPDPDRTADRSPVGVPDLVPIPDLVPVPIPVPVAPAVADA